MKKVYRAHIENRLAALDAFVESEEKSEAKRDKAIKNFLISSIAGIIIALIYALM